MGLLHTSHGDGEVLKGERLAPKKNVAVFCPRESGRSAPNSGDRAGRVLNGDELGIMASYNYVQ